MKSTKPQRRFGLKKDLADEKNTSIFLVPRRDESSRALQMRTVESIQSASRKVCLESFSNDEENENQNETQRKLVEELDNKDERDKTKVTMPKTVTTVTKMGAMHTKFNTSPLFLRS